MGNVKISYTINGFHKFARGTIIAEDEDTLTVQTHADSTIKVAKRVIDELIEDGVQR